MLSASPQCSLLPPAAESSLALQQHRPTVVAGVISKESPIGRSSRLTWSLAHDVVSCRPDAVGESRTQLALLLQPPPSYVARGRPSLGRPAALLAVSWKARGLSGTDVGPRLSWLTLTSREIDDDGSR